MMKVDNELFHEKYHEIYFKDKAGSKISSYAFWYTAYNKGGTRLISIHCNFKKTTKKIKESTGNNLLLKEDWNKIRAFHNYILNHLYENLPSMSELAKIAGLNEYKLKIGFKKLYKISIFRLQTRERMKHAELLVNNTLMPIKQIAQHLGYSDSSHFSTVFKKHFGISPGKFRKQHGKDSP
jgi:AraC-like DNA-binding protein